MIKLTDYIMDRLAGFGVTDVFMVSGGGAMHLVDSLGKHPTLRYICPHHEQAAAIAAEGYTRASGKLAVVVVTSGPGSTNTLTGVIGQWLDSVPVLYLSGQVKQETTIESCRELGLRQLGDQEINITDIVRPVTKYAAIVSDPVKIRYHLDKAIFLATHGRPGPVLLDVPLDVQAAMIDDQRLPAYDEREDGPIFDEDLLYAQVSEVLDRLSKAERPVVLAGQGIRIAGARHLFRKIAERMGIPILTSFCGFDLIPSSHELFAGRPGTLGSRYGNFVLQNADLLLAIGTRNNIRQVSYNWSVFARGAFKVVVDIDASELKKPTVRPDLPIHADAGRFLEILNSRLGGQDLPDWSDWRAWCAERKRRYPVVLPEYWQEKRVNPYCFIEALTKALPEENVTVAGNGSACVVMFQAGIVKEDQRTFWNSGCAAMGYDLPAAIGACFGTGRRPVVCLAGDGSLQMNIQELETVAFHKLPIKLFYLNNNGYVSIRQTQDSFFESRYVGCGPESGVGLPEILRVAEAYGLPTAAIRSHSGMQEEIERVLGAPGPVVCEVLLAPEQNFHPRVASEKKPDGRIISKPLEDMYPFLPRDEFADNMILEPLQED